MRGRTPVQFAPDTSRMEKRRTRKDRVERVVNTSSIWLIVAYLLLMPLETLGGLPAAAYVALDRFEITATCLFAVEYFFRVWAVDRKKDYVLSFYGIVDFIAIFPALVLPMMGMQELRALRLLRLFRLTKAIRYSKAAQRFGKAIADSKEEIVIFLSATVVLLYIASVGIYHFEHEAQPEAFASVFHAWWWAVATLTTVGYGDVYPITTGGRVFTSIIVLLGLGIVAMLTGIVASALSKVKREADTNDPGSSCE